MEIENHSTDCELVLALVAPVGVNLDDVQNKLQSFLTQFRYSVNIIHLSQVAKQFENVEETSLPEHSRLDNAMTLGNTLRERSGRGDVFSLLAINKINEQRELEDYRLKPLGRVTHIIRSLKHPDEVETLRQAYGSGFFLLGISSSIDSRRKYLKDEKGVDEKHLDRLISRDDKEKKHLGQRTRDVFQLADAFISLDSDSDTLSEQLGRILDLLFSRPDISPTSDEYAMFMAYAASLRSADLSRQVGAVLANIDSDIIATGANDVPKFGGGLYWPGKADQRDHVLQKDSNEEQKNKIIMNIMKKIKPTAEQPEDEILNEGKELMKDTGLLEITEYGRAVHAEMEALLSSARNGVSTRNATLYTTTYPCHNCAKHIVAAGITKVLYIEPYPKSYAKILHGDSILVDGDHNLEETSKVIFKQFTGIGPKCFMDLFSMNLSSGRKLIRKENGMLKKWKRNSAELRVPMTPLSYIDAETILIGQLGSIELGETG